MKILLSTVNLPGAWLIRFTTFGRYSHCDVLLDDGTLIGATISAGVSRVPVGERLKKVTRIAVLEIEMTPGEEREVVSALRSQLNRDYDWLAVFGWLFRQNWDSRKSWFCSELVAWAFRQAQVHLVSKRALVKRVTPRDIYISPRCELTEETADSLLARRMVAELDSDTEGE